MSAKNIIANWKMPNLNWQALAKLVDNLLQAKIGQEKSKLVICPPAIYLNRLKEKFANSQIQLGGQNVAGFAHGAFTGQHSVAMLQEAGCSWVLIGHSECRQHLYEDNGLLAKKFFLAYHAGLIPVLCIGESAQDKASNKTAEVLLEQLSSIFAKLPKALPVLSIAYEPIWAIGTGLSASSAEISQVHQFIRRTIVAKSWCEPEGLSIYYGGSVNAQNASDLLANADIAGLLVGGASLKAAELLNICQLAAES